MERVVAESETSGPPPTHVPRGLVGITGGLGVGKTTVLQILREKGAEVLDADDVVHRLYAPGEAAYRAIRRRWGADVLQADGTIDRTRVADLVFGTPTERRWLNGLVHPLVRKRIRIAACRTPGLLFCAIPLLFEVRWERDMWRTVAVWCPEAVQMKRLEQRGWSGAEIRRRLATQLPMNEKLHRADYGLINFGSLELLRRQCEILRKKLEHVLTVEDARV
ncbi:MAG: dephospho-CoA kinase [Kiritimatiellaeota bacterium]|nr:dephospho-CoA kinase [Kiritimatiellota bacterium]